jgi:hypothetical protein
MNAWEARYQSGDRHWDKGEPAPGLVDFLRDHPELPRGTVAIPGCGLGHDVRAWAEFGFDAHGFDIAPSAIQLATSFSPARSASQPTPDPSQEGKCSASAPRRVPLPGGVRGGSVAFTLGDFLSDEPLLQFDYVFEHTLFCAIQPAEREAYVEAVLRWLKPGGTYVAINYILCDGEPPFPVDRAELWRRFQPHFHLIDQWIPRSYPNRTGRELMSWWRRK